MTLPSQERKELIKLRLENAHTAIEDAVLLLNNNSLRSSMSRIFYSMFYAVSALAIADGKSFNKHRALLAYFHKKYASTRILDRKHGRALQKAFEDRSEADYQDYLHITREQIQERIAEAREFIQAIQEHLSNQT